MPYLRPLGPRLWSIQVSRGSGPDRVRLTVPVYQGTERQAQRQAALLEEQADAEWQRRRDARLAEAAALAAGGPTLGEYLAEWLATIQATRAPTTTSVYAGIVAAVTVALGAVRLRALTPAQCRALGQDWLRSGRRRRDPRAPATAGLTPRVVRWRLSILHAALAAAVTAGLLPANPVTAERSGERRPDGPPPRRRVLTVEQAQRLLVALEAPPWHQWRPILLTLLYCGLRLSEARGLLREDVQIEARRLLIRRQVIDVRGRDVAVPHTKSRRPRLVPIPAPLLPVLTQTLATHPYDLAFCGPQGAPLSVARLRAALRRLLASAALPSVTPHELRHSYATILLAAGVPITYVSWLLGHVDTRLAASVYGHPLESALAAAADQLGTFLTPPEDELPKMLPKVADDQETSI